MCLRTQESQTWSSFWYGYITVPLLNCRTQLAMVLCWPEDNHQGTAILPPLVYSLKNHREWETVTGTTMWNFLRIRAIERTLHQLTRYGFFSASPSSGHSRNLTKGGWDLPNHKHIFPTILVSICSKNYGNILQIIYLLYSVQNSRTKTSC